MAIYQNITIGILLLFSSFCYIQFCVFYENYLKKKTKKSSYILVLYGIISFIFNICILTISKNYISDNIYFNVLGLSIIILTIHVAIVNLAIALYVVQDKYETNVTITETENILPK